MKRIPIDVQDFKEIIDNNFYYVDKTMFIKDILGEYLDFYIRPHLFGKSLNLSMLYYFFSLNEKDNAYLFHDLEISKDKEAMKYQNQYPVLYFSLKHMKGKTFDEQISMFSNIIQELCHQYSYLKDSPYISDFLKREFMELYNGTTDKDKLMDSLCHMTECLKQHYQKCTIVLIDDYDIPYLNAYHNDFFEETKIFLDCTFVAVFKGHDLYLEKGILTGLYEIPRGDDFGGGFNNHNEYGVLDCRSTKCFGFEYDEVFELLKYYRLESYFNEVVKWYGGYKVGNTDLFNTSSVLKYVDYVLNGESTPQVFWQDNDLIYHYLSNDKYGFLRKLELLVNGDSMIKRLFFGTIYHRIDNRNYILNFLLYTGYLTVKSYIDVSHNIYELEIPNEEVKQMFMAAYHKWFKEYVDSKRNDLITALNNNKKETAISLLSDIFGKTLKNDYNDINFYLHLLIDIFSPYDIVYKENHIGFDMYIQNNNICIVLRYKISDGIRYLKTDAENMLHQDIDDQYTMHFDSVYIYALTFYNESYYITG